MSVFPMTTLNYPLNYKRQKTRVVNIGKLSIGGENPILIQSMLSSSTTDVKSCLNEIERLHLEGCELIRLAIPSHKDLNAIPRIRTLLTERGLDINLVADIHYLPNLALDACEIFEKVRINPGNYCDSPKNSKKSVQGAPFEEGYQQLKEALLPLVRALKIRKRALRIGVNQGSLSTRMIERFGDSPMGMVQSALETAKILENFDYRNFVISLKSSNPIVVQKAYRLLYEEQTSDIKIPLHLGVTEAGSGSMARIKSEAGIGSLLFDGIGDTIRVSLTEPSENEVIFARKILQQLDLEEKNKQSTNQDFWARPLNHQRVINKGIVQSSRTLGGGEKLQVGIISSMELPKCKISFDPDFTIEISSEGYYFEQFGEAVKPIKASLLKYQDSEQRKSLILIDDCSAKFELREYYQKQDTHRSAALGLLLPSTPLDHKERINLASILSEGLIDFVIIPELIKSKELETILLLLQATRSKTYITDFIACPSCGRTLFDLESTTKKIKQETRHLKGLKIGIMGCIVNGPGEMADADFGYVGSGKGKIDLYYGQRMVKRGIEEGRAVQSLIDLIKERGMWQDPPQ